MLSHTVSIVPLYAAALAVLFLGLSLRVIAYRRRERIAFGSAGDLELERRIRVHGNFAEYVPLILLLLLIAESRGASVLSVHAACILLLFGRLAHGIGVSRSASDDVGRIVGMTGTQSAALLAVGLIVSTYI